MDQSVVERKLAPSLIGTPDLSVVVPVYNEEGNVAEFTRQVVSVLEQMDVEAELILVDDGSSDRTWSEVCAVAADAGARGIRLCRNFGHQHALMAGLSHARGRAVVTMDGDLQHPPALLPVLYEEWASGHRIVQTRRLDGGVEGSFKRLTSKWYYWLFSRATGVEMSEGSSDFRLLDRGVLAEILRFGDQDIFLRGMVQWVGADSATVPYEVGERFAGTSKFTLRKMLRFAAGAMVSFTTKPLRAGIWLGSVCAAASVVELIYVVVQWALGHTVPGWASIVGVMSLLFAAVFLMLGILGIYLARIHEVLQCRPRFIVSETVGCDDRAT